MNAAAPDAASHPDGRGHQAGSPGSPGATGRPASVLVAGASGLIGTALLRSLRADGVRAAALVRRPPHGPDEIEWDPGRALDPGVLAGFEAAVCLSGAGVGDRRWSAAYKRTLAQSRVVPTRTLSEAIRSAGQHGPRTLISGSAVGYYGDQGAAPLAESAPAGTEFLAQLCRHWEAAADPAREAARVVSIRTGIVLSRRGGVLQRLARLFRLGAGGRLGSGRQYFPWITLRDEVRAIRFALDSPQLQGPVNLVAPQDTTNREFTAALARAMHRPALLPAPTAALRLALGQFAEEGVLSSQRAQPAALLAGGFAFEDPQIDAALAWALADRD